MLINRTRHGNMILPGPHASLPWKWRRPPTPRSPPTKPRRRREISTYSKSAPSAAFGRVYLGGEEQDMWTLPAKAAEAAIKSVTGRAMKGSGGA
jgi:hypothetical protein